MLRVPRLQGGASGPYRTTTDEDGGLYHTAKDPLEVDEDGIEMSSAPVALGHASKHGKDVVRRTESDQEQRLPPGASSQPWSTWLQTTHSCCSAFESAFLCLNEKAA